MTPKKYPQNVHTPKNIHLSENPKKYWNSKIWPKKNGPSLRMYENIWVPPLGHGYPLRVKIPSLMLYWEMTKIFNYHKIRYFITSDRRQSRRLWTIDERGSQIARIFHLSPVRQTNCNPKSLFLTVFDLRSSIASTFTIATYPVCVLIQWIRNQNNLKQELGVIYIFQSCFCWKKSLFPHRIVSNRNTVNHWRTRIKTR